MGKKKNRMPGGIWRLDRDGKLPEIDPLKRLGTRKPFKPVDFGDSKPKNRAVSLRRFRT